MKRLQDRVALVTGAGRGIGKGIALRLAQEGATVAILDLDRDTAEAAAGEINASCGEQSFAVEADVTDSGAIKRAIATLLNRVGKLDILVNNAGWDRLTPFVDTTEDFWDRIIQVNLKGPVITTRAVLDHMIERQYGRIVNISSDAGRVGSGGEVVYSGAKAGVIGFTKALAKEMARNRITLNVVSPGSTDTPLLDDMKRYAGRLVEAGVKLIPMRRLGTPQDVASAVAFFASDDSEYITGQVLSVNGGMNMPD